MFKIMTGLVVTLLAIGGVGAGLSWNATTTTSGEGCCPCCAAGCNCCTDGACSCDNCGCDGTCCTKAQAGTKAVKPSCCSAKGEQQAAGCCPCCVDGCDCCSSGTCACDSCCCDGACCGK
jgi:hypothetical protein